MPRYQTSNVPSKNAGPTSRRAFQSNALNNPDHSFHNRFHCLGAEFFNLTEQETMVHRVNTLSANDSQPQLRLVLSDSPMSIKPESESSVANTSSSSPPALEVLATPLHPIASQFNGLVRGEGEGPRRGAKGQIAGGSGGSIIPSPINAASGPKIFQQQMQRSKPQATSVSYASATAGFVNAPSDSKTSQQYMEGRTTLEQYAGHVHSHPGQHSANEIQSESQESVGGDSQPEAVWRQGEAFGLTGSGVLSGITSALGLRVRKATPQLSTNLERDYQKLREEYQWMQDELFKAEQKLAFELQKTENQVKWRYNNAMKAPNEVYLSRNAGKLKILHAFLDENVFTFASALDALKVAANATSDFLVENIIFRSSEAFPHEIEEAQATILPFLGASLVELLSTQADKASTTGSDAEGSRLLVSLVSQTFVYAYLGRTEKPAKAEVLALYANIFKIASWALPGAVNRSAFDKILGTLFSASQQVRSTNQEIDPGLNVSIAIPLPGPTGSRYDHLVEEAVDVQGIPIESVGGADEHVIATLTFGLKRGDKVTLRPQVLLRSTIEEALEQEERDLRLNEPLSVQQPECDGRG